MLTLTLYTERLLLRQLALNDEQGILAIRSNNEVNKYIGRSGDVTLEDARNFIKKILANNGSYYWAITLKEKDELIGTICYWNLEPALKKAEIGYELHPGSQGKGIMHEALSAVIKFGFEVLQFDVITAFPQAENKRSVKLLARNDFKLYAVEEDGYHEYRLNRDAWLANGHK